MSPLDGICGVLKGSQWGGAGIHLSLEASPYATGLRNSALWREVVAYVVWGCGSESIQQSGYIEHDLRTNHYTDSKDSPYSIWLQGWL